MIIVCRAGKIWHNLIIRHEDDTNKWVWVVKFDTIIFNFRTIGPARAMSLGKWAFTLHLNMLLLVRRGLEAQGIISRVGLLVFDSIFSVFNSVCNPSEFKKSTQIGWKIILVRYGLVSNLVRFSSNS